MKALVYTRYGPPEVLALQEAEKPVPKETEILVRVFATSVNYGDLIARRFSEVSLREFNMPLPFWFLARLSFGFRKPKTRILGSEFAGEIESVGRGVTRFQPGDPVFGYLGQKMGAYAEYVCLPEDGEVAAKPAHVSYSQAAVVPYGAITALNLLQKTDIRHGSKVLIIGASGSIGSAAVQLAKNLGAEVTGVCSTPRLEWVRSIGADKVIDYTRDDFTQNGETYELIFDVLGRSSFARCENSLAEGGCYLLASFKARDLWDMLRTSMTGGKKVVCALSPDRSGDLPYIKELVETGVIRASIDRTFPLEQAAEAHRYVESGGKRGHIAITVGA